MEAKKKIIHKKVNMNIDKKLIILDALEKLRKQEIADKQVWKARAYLVVIKNIKAIDKPIYTFDDIKNIDGIGKGIGDKIKEIIESGKLERLDNYNAEGHIGIIDELMKIHGIGPAKANDLVKEHGIKSIEDMKNHIELLNDKQKMGLKYYEDTMLRIPRKEMEKHDDYLQSIVKSIDKNLNATLTGSYRRKLKDSGDIDVLITHKDDPENHEEIIKSIVEKLKADKYILDTFAFGEKKCLAVCKLKRHRTVRRIDLMYTPLHEYPFALLYFTGSGSFNVSMRNIALSKGYSLSEYGLKHSQGDKKGQFVDHTFKNEKDIFNFLGMEYVEPEKRL